MTGPGLCGFEVAAAAIANGSKVWRFEVFDGTSRIIDLFFAIRFYVFELGFNDDSFFH